MGFSLIPRHHEPRDARRRAIAETNAFLNWAMSTDAQMPRIPRRRVDKGGFNELLRRPSSCRIIAFWWAKALERVRDV